MIRPEVTQLYKYRAFNKYSIPCLVDEIVWVSSQKELNDPYENTFYIQPDMSYEMLSRRNGTATKKNFVQKQEELITGILNDFITGGIFCLSESSNINLMWSHYADSHRGYCIGYERSKTTLLGSERCSPVSYGSFPTMKLSVLFEAMQTRNELLARNVFKSMVLSKDPNWRYEKEWRILFDQVNQLIKIDAPIRSITFGMRMADAEKDQIRSVLKQKSGIEYFQARKSDQDYDLRIEMVD